MKVAIALGTRPEIVKMAPIIRACQATGLPFVLIHTNQHYSYELDGVFFDELGLPQPAVQLDVGSGSHAYQISTILSRIEPMLCDDPPDVVLVEGDTNSVVGVALAARTLGIPVGHVEAGLRSYDRAMPEELNRILVDHISDVCFAPTDVAVRILTGEGIAPERVVLSGNTIVDEVLRQRPRAEALDTPGLLGLAGRRYVLATVHRAENTDDPDRLRGIMHGLARVGSGIGLPIVAALHPRTVARLERYGLDVPPAIRVLPPLGYLQFLGLQAAATLVMTDSGGLQEEACTLGVPCVTLRDSTERPESIEVGANMLAGADPERIETAARTMVARPTGWANPFGDGASGARIVAWLSAASEGLLSPRRAPNAAEAPAPDMVELLSTKR